MRFMVFATLALGLGLSGPASAGPAAGTTYDDWKVECEKASQSAPEKCFLSQIQMVKENNARLLKASIGYIGPQNEPILVVAAPLGIDLRAGVAIRIDDGLKSPLTVQRCVQEGCVASIAFDSETLPVFTEAKKILIGMLPYGAPQSLVVAISTKGLSKGMAALKK